MFGNVEQVFGAIRSPWSAAWIKRLYIVKRFEGVTRIVFLTTKPYAYQSRIAINSAHHPNFVVALPVVVLVNTDGIDPDDPLLRLVSQVI